MNFYIKEWANNTATLMTDCGKVLWIFSSVAVAYKVCQEYYDSQIHTHSPFSQRGDVPQPQILV